MRFFYGKPAHSQIYSELKKLEKLGLLVSRVENSGPRLRRLYKITSTGLDAATRWAKQKPVDPPALRNPPLLRVLLGHLSDPASLMGMLQQHVAYADQMQREAAKEVRWAGEDPSWAYAKVALKWAERYYASEPDLALKLIKDLDEAEASFPKAVDGVKIPWPPTSYGYEVERKADAEDTEDAD